MARLRDVAAALAATLAVAAAPACQYVAGIAGETSACPSPKGVSAYQCDDACTKYCTSSACAVPSLYPDLATCCLVCSQSAPATQTCRASAVLASSCEKAGAFLSSSKKVCDDQQGAFADLFAVVCPGRATPTSATFDATRGPATLLEAAQARAVGCAESADCLCKEVAKDTPSATAIAACQDDYDACVEACSLTKKAL